MKLNKDANQNEQDLMQNYNNNQVITRFAPSPTGNLHIGGARTALFNYLFAKHHNGKFLLRIEDTDSERSKDEYRESIIQSLNWLGIKHDDEIIFQSKNTARYLEVANAMLENETAYKCFLTQEEIEKQREAAEKAKVKFVLNSKWRDATEKDHPLDAKFSIRLRTPLNQDIVINDIVQGNVTINSSEIDDQILVRSNGLPTYMLAVVVDDHDMNVTHIIRGDDHLINTPKQILIYNALNWKVPIMHHISLIHAQDGAKLSKRHGATSMIEYQDKYLPNAICNYFLNLGWHSNEATDIMSAEEQIAIFNANGFRKAPARLDFEKLNNINHKHICMLTPENLINCIAKHNDSNPENQINLSSQNIQNITLATSSILERCKILLDIIPIAKLYTQEFKTDNKINLTDLQKEIVQDILIQIDELFLDKEIESKDKIETLILKQKIEQFHKNYAAMKQLKLGVVMLPVRLALTGEENSPSMFELLAIIGKNSAIDRLKSALAL